MKDGFESHTSSAKRPLPFRMGAVIPFFDMLGPDFRQSHVFESGHEVDDVKIEISSRATGDALSIG